MDDIKITPRPKLCEVQKIRERLQLLQSELFALKKEVEHTPIDSFEILEFGLWLDSEVKRSKISIVELARETNIPKSTLHGWTAGSADRYFIRFKTLLSFFRRTE